MERLGVGVFPLAAIETRQLFRLVATSGCVGPKACSRMAKASFIFMGMGDKNFHMGFEDDNRGFLIYAPSEVKLFEWPLSIPRIS